MSGKYSKFDSFLKRKLSNGEYKEVKIYEPCVVTSSREKHVFRFTFVTRDKIYITENPPKSLLYWIHLKYVIDIDVLNDEATFLQSQLRDTVQHIVVKYISNDEGNLKSSKSTANFQNEANTQRRHSEASSRVLSRLFSFSSTRDVTSLSRSASLWSNTGADFQNGGVPHSSNSMNSNYGEQSLQGSWSLIKREMKHKPEKLSDAVRWMQEDPYLIQVLTHNNGLMTQQTVDELHVYILNENTTFLHMLKSAWKNWIIFHNFSKKQGNGQPDGNSTLAPENVTSSPGKSSSRDDTTRMLFAGLKEELQFTQDVENLYRLFNELNVSSMQNVFIKSLFWRDDILLKRFVDLAHGYVRESVAANIDERADEIELTVSILQTIAVMLRETEALPHCYRVLQNLSRSYFSKLIEVLLSPPNMAAQGWSRDSNISSLISEGTVASSEVLYEVINATQQITWVVDGESPAFNAIVLFNVIGQSKQLTDFLDRLMAACRKSWEFGSDGSMGSSDRAPEDAVKVYRLFTVFHRIITGSNNAAQYAKDSFKEEFKYYIHPGSVAEKFPAEYPISGMGRAVVHAVGSCISSSAH